jgi:hypothetical protein
MLICLKVYSYEQLPIITTEETTTEVNGFFDFFFFLFFLLSFLGGFLSGSSSTSGGRRSSRDGEGGELLRSFSNKIVESLSSEGRDGVVKFFGIDFSSDFLKNLGNVISS